MESNTITIERTFQLPVEVAWKAFSEASSLKQWWGPNDYTCPHFSNEFKVGGKYLAAMEDKKGNVTWGTGVYKEIIPYKRIVVTDSFCDSNGKILSGSEVGMPGSWPDVMLVTYEFQEHEDTTLFLLIHEGLPPEAQQDCIEGWSQCLDKMENIFRYFRQTSNSLEE